ncbi:MAG TPA: phosphatase PAP2 family protein [Hyphomonas sp.]|nr:phosphatase PAP2 family protein [Hyphomonas sp.]MCB9962039.1 phosphatase PAP2 family protein [Hyphomonas sp.]MCB9971031.1 phosphatase PAP2 family protein [Hyphomonas sp.]HPE48062.1 phosphatase PAP2 family protein [Hyphomonas sp.]
MFSTSQLARAAAISAGVLGVLTTGVLGLWPLHAIDQAFSDLVSPLRNPGLDTLMLVVTALGDGLFLTLAGTVTVIAFLFAGARWRAFSYSVAFLLMPLAVHGIKWLVERARPRDLAFNGTDMFSFPSGHAANAALIYGAIAALSAITFKGRIGHIFAASFLLLPLMIGVSRIYLGAHWLSDVLASYALAVLFLVLLALAVARHPEPPHPSKAIPIALFVIAAAFPIYLFLTLPDASALYRAIELHEPASPG